MSEQYNSVREALAHYYSCSRGPQLAQPRYAKASRSTGHTPWDHVLIGALLRGDPSQPGCETGLAVEHGDDLDAELEEWSLGFGVELSDRAADVVRQLRTLMERHELKPETRPARASDVVRWTDPEGRKWARLRPDHVAPLTLGGRAAQTARQSSG